MRPLLLLIVGASFTLNTLCPNIVKGEDSHGEEPNARKSADAPQEADLRNVLNQIKAYHDKLLPCNNDKGAKAFAELLAGLPEVKATTNQATESLSALLQSLKSKASESGEVLHARIFAVKKVLAAKTQKFQADRQSFEAEDRQLEASLGNLERLFSLTSTFDEEKAKTDPKTSAIITKAETIITDYTNVKCGAGPNPSQPPPVSNPAVSNPTEGQKADPAAKGDLKAEKDSKKGEKNNEGASKASGGKPRAEEGAGSSLGSPRLGGGLGLGGLFPPGLGKGEKEKSGGGSSKQGEGGQPNLGGDSGKGDSDKSASSSTPKPPEKKDPPSSPSGGATPPSGDQNSKNGGEKKSEKDGDDKKLNLGSKEDKREPTPSPSASKEDSKNALEAIKEQQQLQLKAMAEQQQQGAQANGTNANRPQNQSSRSRDARTAPPRAKSSGFPTQVKKKR